MFVGLLGNQATVSLLLEPRRALGLEINAGRKALGVFRLRGGGSKLEEHEEELVCAKTFKERVRNVSVFIVFSCWIGS